MTEYPESALDECAQMLHSYFITACHNRAAKRAAGNSSAAQNIKLNFATRKYADAKLRAVAALTRCLCPACRGRSLEVFP